MIALQSSKLLLAQDVEYNWTKFMKAGTNTLVETIADANGNTYTIGNFNGYFDFNQFVGNDNDLTTNCIFNGFNFECFTNAYIQKLDSSGNLLFLLQLGGDANLFGNSIKQDATGAILVAGRFDGIVDFEPGSEITNLSSTNGNLFILKLDSNGNFLWVKQFFGSANINLLIVPDAAGNIFTVSEFYNTLVVNNSINLTSNGNSDIFIQKFDSNGNFIWVKQIGGIGVDFPIALNLDSNNNLYTTGHFDFTVDFDPGSSVNAITAQNRKFMQKLDSDGNFQWAMQFPFQDVSAVAFDQNDNILLTGFFMGTVDFDTSESVSTLTSIGNNDIYIEKINPDGTFAWVKQIFGTTDNDRSIAITSDNHRNVYTTGRFWSTVNFTTNGAGELTSMGGYDVFIHKLSSTGNFEWVKQIGGTETQDAKNIAVDNSGNIYTTGYFAGNTDFDPSMETANLVSSGSTTFIQKMSPVSLSIDENIEQLFKIYPNPSNGTFIFDIEKLVADELILYDVFGKQLEAKTNVSSGIFNFYLSTGIYYLKINIQNRQLVKKLIIK